MALTNPFINTIPNFDATQGITINLNVLGGDAINGYGFKIYNDDGSLTPIYTSGNIGVQNDVASVSVRSFSFSIPTTIGLLNNRSYKIEPFTYQTENGAIVSTVTGQQVLFSCYATPTYKLQYLNSNNVYVDLQDGTMFTSTQQQFLIIFNTNDLSSLLVPNYANVVLYGVDESGNQNLIKEYTPVYNFEQNQNNLSMWSVEIDISDFSRTMDADGNPLSPAERAYASFSLSLRVVPIGHFSPNETITYKNLGCGYNAVNSSSIFRVTNLCDKGQIEIVCTATSREGKSNITPLENLIYIDNDELDLNTATYGENAYAFWEKYFTTGQPYTLRIWGRNFEVGEIASLYLTTDNGRYVSIKYNEEDVYDEDTSTWSNYTYISLESGRNDANGQPMFPYYIESERILTSTITSSTDLFVGIQAQNGLFDISFQKI